jgi:DNA-binding FrmR family transcriptional regulator
MKIQSATTKEELNRRLRRIEGQARGVQRMLADDRDCREIVQQLNAINAAVHHATLLFMRAYAKDCLMGAGEMGERDPEVVVDELVDLMAKVR